MSYRKQEAAAFAARIHAMGFAVYLAESGEYGFITDETESRVLSFSFGIGSPNLGGNYGPPSRESGTGWRMDTTPGALRTAYDVKAALYAGPPDWLRGRGWKYLSTVEQYRAEYQRSSKFERFVPEARAS